LNYFHEAKLPFGEPSASRQPDAAPLDQPAGDRGCGLAVLIGG